MTKELYKELRGPTREYIYSIWQLAQTGMIPTDDEDATMAQALLDHAEYHHIWNQLPELEDQDIEIDGVNPLLHVNIHSVVENQIAAGDPSSVVHALRRLMRQGLPRHEAIHRIGAILIQEIWEIMADNRPFDAQGYDQAVHRLGRERPRPSKRHKRRKKKR